MPARKFRYVEGQGIIETTPESEKAVCDEIHKATEKFQEPLDFKGARKRRRAALWPRYAEFLGVHPSQREAAQKQSVELGVPTEFNEAGDPYFTSQQHENKYIKAIGYYHKNAGYSDVAPDKYVESTHGPKARQKARTERKEKIARLEEEVYREFGVRV